MFLDGNMTFEGLVKQHEITRGYMARLIVFGALCLTKEDKDERAAALWHLFEQKGIGYIKAIKKYEAQIKLVSRQTME